jgi:hypothetical protein
VPDLLNFLFVAMALSDQKRRVYKRRGGCTKEEEGVQKEEAGAQKEEKGAQRRGECTKR